MTTIAIVSDIHANHVALDILLADLGVLSPDRVVCLGDVAATGPGPHHVIERLRLLDWEFIRGNCDDAVLRYAAGAGLESADEHFVIDQWCATQLTADDLLFVTSFKPVARFEFEGFALCCYHGSPRSNLDEILPDTPIKDLDRWFRGQAATIYAGGHTHLQMVRRYRDGYVINPGSVGMPYSLLPDGDAINPLVVEYAVIRIEGAELAIELRRIPVEAEAIRAAAELSDMPHRDWWVSDWR